MNADKNRRQKYMIFYIYDSEQQMFSAFFKLEIIIKIILVTFICMEPESVEDEPAFEFISDD